VLGGDEKEKEDVNPSELENEIFSWVAKKEVKDQRIPAWIAKRKMKSLKSV